MIKKIFIVLITIPIFGCVYANNRIGENVKFGTKAALTNLWKEAEFRWRMALEEDPNNFKAMNNLAVAYERLGKLEFAKETYEKALKISKNNPYVKKNYDSFLLYYKKQKNEKNR
ncbi:MAG: tetratricopeptide repeat protein [Acidobacteriota bacterium]